MQVVVRQISFAAPWRLRSAREVLLRVMTMDRCGSQPSSTVAQVNTSTGDVYCLHGDVVGSTREVADSTGNIVVEFDYDMYGDVRVVSGSADATSFLFAGECQDPTRMPYAYAAGNPLQGADPLGLYGWGDLWDDVTDTAGAVFGPGGVVGCSAAASPIARPVTAAIGKAIQPLRPTAQRLPKLTPQTQTAANSETAALFRAVGPDEAADIASTGTFNNPAGINVKYFVTNAGDATRWGNFLNPGESTIVSTRVPTAALDGAMFEPRWDGIGPAWILDETQVAKLNQAMDGITVAP